MPPQTLLAGFRVAGFAKRNDNARSLELSPQPGQSCLIQVREPDRTGVPRVACLGGVGVELLPTTFQ